MALFCRWFESRFPNKDLPVREDVVYEYFCELRSSQPSASRAEHLSRPQISLQRFLDIKEPLMLQLPYELRAPPSTCFWTNDLAEGRRKSILYWSPRWKLLSTGHSWFLSSMCVRYNAGLGCKSHGSVWENFFEATLLRTKTARSHGKENIFSTNMSPAYGLLGVNWCAAFFTTRRELDLMTWTLSCCHLLTLCVIHTPFPQHVWTRGSGSCLTRPPPLLSSMAEAKRIAGRTLDLEAAYKQMLVSGESLWASVSHVLPFGASASVYAFNRMAKALRVVGVRLFGLVWSQYFDDFPQLDLAKSGDAGQRTAERFLDLVGWQYSCKTSKRRSASRVFDILGVTFEPLRARAFPC